LTQSIPLTLDAITRAIIGLRPSGQAAADQIRASLGVITPADRSESETVPSKPDNRIEQTRPIAAGMADTVPVIADPVARQRTKPPRLTRLFQLQEAREVQRPLWFDDVASLPLQYSVSERRRRPEPLMPAAATRGIIKALLASDRPDGAIDIEALIASLGKAKPLTRWPRRRIASLERGAAVVVDRGPQLAPFRPDVGALVRALRNVIGGTRLLLHFCNGWPPKAVTARDAGSEDREDDAVLAVAPRTPVLVISDFGLSPVPAGTVRSVAEDWCAFAGALQGIGCEPIGLLPFPESEWPQDLARSFNLVHWTTSMNARTARRAREQGRHCVRAVSSSGDAAGETERETLARAVAPAARIDHALSRAMRLAVLPHSSPALEARLWWGDDVGSRGEAAITLGVHRAGELRADLRAEQPQEDDRRLALIARMHQDDAPTLRLEEEILALDIRRPANWDSTIADRLRALLRSLLHGGGDETKYVRNAARWCLTILPRLELPPAALGAARDLIYAAAQRLGTLPLSAGPLAHPEGPPEWLTAALHSDTGRSNIQIAIAWDRQGLQVRPATDIEGQHTIEITDAAYAAIAASPE
jgi:hypothetical protein